ncbi:hypothetical protein [Rosistilla ulvae]|nr:hypothetical protein [Rosistilla ulvae]
MTSQRKLRYESLEARRLLASDITIVPGFPSDSNAIDHRNQPLLAPLHAAAVEIAVSPGHATDGLIHESEGRVVVVDSSQQTGFASRLWIFDRDDHGGLRPARDVIDPGFHVDRMLIDGDRAIVFGTQWTWQQGTSESASLDGVPLQTLVATIDLQTPSPSPRQAIQQTVPGLLKELHLADRHLILVMHSELPTIATIDRQPAPETVHSFAITDDGLREIASQPISAGITRPLGDRLLTLTTRDDTTEPFNMQDSENVGVPLHNWLTQYAVGAGAIAPVAEIDLGSGWIGSFQIANDQTATAVRTVQSDGSGIATSIDILDLSGDSIRLFDSLTVANFAGYAIAAQPDFVLLYDQATPEWLVLVDIQSQHPGTAQPVRQIELDSDWTLHPEGLRMSNNRVVVLATRPLHVDPIDRLRDLSIDGDQGTAALLLTISLDDAKLVAISPLGNLSNTLPHPALHSIDAARDRVGMFIEQHESDTAKGSGFLYGHLDDAGNFVAEGLLRDLQPDDEIDIDPRRLMARGDGQLAQHRWDQPDQPAMQMPLVDPNGPT